MPQMAHAGIDQCSLDGLLVCFAIRKQPAAMRSAPQAYGLLNRKWPIALFGLRHQSNLLCGPCGRTLPKIATLQQHGPTQGTKEAGQRPEQGSLAGTVWSQQNQDFSKFNRERQRIQ